MSWVALSRVRQDEGRLRRATSARPRARGSDACERKEESVIGEALDHEASRESSKLV